MAIQTSQVYQNTMEDPVCTRNSSQQYTGKPFINNIKVIKFPGVYIYSVVWHTLKFSIRRLRASNFKSKSFGLSLSFLISMILLILFSNKMYIKALTFQICTFSWYWSSETLYSFSHIIYSNVGFLLCIVLLTLTKFVWVIVHVWMSVKCMNKSVSFFILQLTQLMLE